MLYNFLKRDNVVLITLFNDKERIIELYNALTGSNYDKDTPVEIVTLENTFFGDRINDFSFIIDHRWIILTEQQSTLCPNLPLRSLVYIAREYEKLVFSRDIYSKKLVKIPTPEFYVFYNGTEEAPVEQELRLSDAFMTNAAECGKISLEVVVKFINVNYEKGAELLTKCKTMQGYSVLIYKIREKQKAHGNLAAAIEESIRECESEGILADFLKEHGGDVMSFLFEKMTREECEAVREADGYDRGFECGKREGEAVGYERGEASGYEAGKLEVAANMKSEGESIEKIVMYTGLSAEEIDEL